MKLEIISPDSVVFSGNVDSVVLPGTSGSFEVLPHHVALISSLKNGEIVYSQGASKTTILVDGGFVEVKRDTISVCVESVLSK